MKLPAPQKQLQLDLGVEIENNVNGIEMGVLENGMAYLTQVGLAAICGAARSTVHEISKEWEDNFGTGMEPPGRARWFSNYLREAGYESPTLYMEIQKNGSPHYAYSDLVCMAFIEYYAFEAQRKNETALANYRRLARYGLNKFIYDALGYKPIDKWKYFNDRVSLLNDAAPDAHFIVFNETNGMIVDLINAGLPISDKTIPDGSVGGIWGRHWTENDLSETFGERIPYNHYYPSYYPQAKSNPQQAWAYPEECLVEFRRWFRNVYLPTKYPEYILRKAKLLSGGKDQAKQIAQLYAPRQLTNEK
ncbi:hypothetical protein [Rhizobium sp. BR 362]|uniref:hypothetical protein n=1 Tax=Rhizobium sp. BR 362 TaxID=3040670 RepID=UPI002F418C9D